MVQVKIIKDGVKGADDGCTVRPYVKGVIYNVSATLAAVFVEAGEGEYPGAEPKAPAVTPVVPVAPADPVVPVAPVAEIPDIPKKSK